MATIVAEDSRLRQGLSLNQSYLQQMCSLSVESNCQVYRMTNIICTIGPACDSVATLTQLIETGMNIARLNLAHADNNYHLKTLRNLQQAITQVKYRVNGQIAIAADLKGPNIRIGKFNENTKLPLLLKREETIVLTCDPAVADNCDKGKIYMAENFIHQAQAGNTIYVGDGPLCFTVLEKDVMGLKCVVSQDGEIDNHSQCHIPLTLPSESAELSEQDKADISFCVENKVDMILVSWVWCPEMIVNVRKQLGEFASRVKVIAKIENYEGVKRINDILEVADGILVGRGDLGIDVVPEKVFLAQKMIIGRANMMGKPVICAAQMLDSMVNSPRPTRAEASDVANAILDGADCIMLSKETAIGKHPVKAVETLASICKEAEYALYHARMYQDLRSATPIPTENDHAASIAAVEAAFRCRASAIVVVTNSGRSATMIARYRPHCIIIAVTRSQQTARHLNLYRGIFAVYHSDASCSEWYIDIDMRIYYALNIAKGQGYVKAKDIAVLVTGYQTGPGSTNTVRSIQVPLDNEKPYFMNIPRTTEHLNS